MTRRLAFIAGCSLIGLAVWVLGGRHMWPRAVRGENDFLQLYAGARLVGTPELYDIEASKRIHREVTEKGIHYEGVYYTRLPYYALLLRPLASLPLRTAHAVYQAVSISLFLLFLILFARDVPEIIALSFLSVPLLVNFLNGQDAGMVAALAGMAILLFRNGRDFTAGLLLSLGAIKFHLLALAALAVVVHRRWRMLAGGVAGGASLVLLSFAAAGLDWPRRFLAVVSNPELHPSAATMLTYRNIASFISGGDNLALEGILILATVALFIWVANRTTDFAVAFSLALSTGLLVCHHAYIQDAVLLLPTTAALLTQAAPRPVVVLTVLANLPPVSFLLFHGWPWSIAVPLLLLGILVTSAYAFGPRSAPAGN